MEEEQGEEQEEDHFHSGILYQTPLSWPVITVMEDFTRIMIIYWVRLTTQTRFFDHDNILGEACLPDALLCREPEMSLSYRAICNLSYKVSFIQLSLFFFKRSKSSLQFSHFWSLKFHLNLNLAS